MLAPHRVISATPRLRERRGVHRIVRHPIIRTGQPVPIHNENPHDEAGPTGENTVQSSFRHPRFALGAALGFAQSRYHFYLLQSFPDVLAARIRSATKKGKKGVKEAEAPQIVHPGKQFVSAAYILGTAVLLGVSWLATSMGQVMMVPAILLPWAGFYWARLFFWRGRV